MAFQKAAVVAGSDIYIYIFIFFRYEYNTYIALYIYIKILHGIYVYIYICPVAAFSVFWNTFVRLDLAFQVLTWISDMSEKARGSSHAQKKNKSMKSWLLVEPTPLKNMGQNGNPPQIGVKSNKKS